jgi:hypothetical protein
MPPTFISRYCYRVIAALALREKIRGALVALSNFFTARNARGLSFRQPEEAPR